MQEIHKKYLKFDKKIVIIGFGSIGQAVLPLIFRHFIITPAQVTVITKHTNGLAVADEYGVACQLTALTKDNYQSLLDQKLQEGDFLLNVSVDVSSVDLIKFCQQKGVLYLDTCIEPWEGGYVDQTLSASARSNYSLREAALKLKKPGVKQPTAVLTHGANPGLVSHFVKQALINIAHDLGKNITIPKTRAEWANLANQLQIKTIHIAERDTQIAASSKKPNEFVNTWSIDGFVSEGFQPAELGWGSHERHFPSDAFHHNFGSQCAIYLDRPGASTRVRTWTPLARSFHGFLITHSEAISISDYLTVADDKGVQYRPTVHYAYHPCEDAVLSIHELAGREWQKQATQRLLSHDIIDGMDELGVLLAGHAKGAYWFGSQLSIHEARKLVPYNTATSLQVAIGVIAGMVWAISHPFSGIVEPEEIDHQYIMNITLPYLGSVVGHYTDWTPLKERGKLFREAIDYDDPWQFINVRVT